jgi:hypothetical protein
MFYALEFSCIVYPVCRVIAFRHFCGELLSKSREWVVMWRTTGQKWVPGLGDSHGVACLGMVTLSK